MALRSGSYCLSFTCRPSISELLPRTPQITLAGRLLVHTELGRVSRDMGKGAEGSSSHRGCSPCTLLLSPCPLLFSLFPPCQHPKHGTGFGDLLSPLSPPRARPLYPSAGSFCLLPPAPRPEVPAPGPPFPSSPGPVKLSHKTCKPSPINLPIHSADISCAGAFSSICWFEVGFLFVLGAPLLSALAVSPAL